MLPTLSKTLFLDPTVLNMVVRFIPLDSLFLALKTALLLKMSLQMLAVSFVQPLLHPTLSSTAPCLIIGAWVQVVPSPHSPRRLLPRTAVTSKEITLRFVKSVHKN